jgi:hypothetical protein
LVGAVAVPIAEARWLTAGGAEGDVVAAAVFAIVFGQLEACA